MSLKVVRNEVDGWDVIREGEDEAISNHVDQASAEAAAKLRAEEEGVGEPDEEPVVVREDEVHGIDDARQGMKPAFLAMAALLTVIAILIVILALTGSLTGFGS